MCQYQNRNNLVDVTLPKDVWWNLKRVPPIQPINKLYNASLAYVLLSPTFLLNKHLIYASWLSSYSRNEARILGARSLTELPRQV